MYLFPIPPPNKISPSLKTRSLHLSQVLFYLILHALEVYSLGGIFGLYLRTIRLSYVQHVKASHFQSADQAPN